MEVPVQVAVRIKPRSEEEYDLPQCLQILPITPNSNRPGIIQVCGQNSFQVSYPLPPSCSQNEVYLETVYPLITLFLEGFDISVVTYGQKFCGKTYTLFGKGNQYFEQSEYGIVQCCVKEIFGILNKKLERNFAINIGWVEIIDENVVDLLKEGPVLCQNEVDVFQWIQIGLANKSQNEISHTLFTITLEQQWISEGLIQHKLSTASFCDLCRTDRMFMPNELNQNESVPIDKGLQSLEKIISMMTSPMLCNFTHIPYDQTPLTTLLKDSFGGRAQTLFILCVSSLEKDVNETIFNLQFAFKIQYVKNYVIMNTFSDNNMPISSGILLENQQDTTFQLQFAALQWSKLVSNAEDLFSKILTNKVLADTEYQQIEEWLYLKQECEECLSLSGEFMTNQKQLGPILETTEPDEIILNEENIPIENNSENESDIESQHPYLEEKLSSLIEEFRLSTNNLYHKKCEDFFQNQLDFKNNASASEHSARRKTMRRQSIQPDEVLNSSEIEMLTRLAEHPKNNTKKNNTSICQDIAEHHNFNRHISPVHNLRKQINELDSEIKAKKLQIKELELTITLKVELESNILKNKDTKASVKQRFLKKKNKLEIEYEKIKKQLRKAVVNGKDNTDIKRLNDHLAHIEQRLQDLTSVKEIANENAQELSKIQLSIQEYKTSVKQLRLILKQDQKFKAELEKELKAVKEKSGSHKYKNISNTNDRNMKMDQFLKESSNNILSFQNTSSSAQESLRQEIINLRKTRVHLLEQQCYFNQKLKKDKHLSYRETRKLLECDEAIEAIDAVIEYKNELMCGTNSINTNEKLQREKGEQMLMARLNKMSVEELRALVYKYFVKVIDLKESSHKLEIQLLELERERDSSLWRERILKNALEQAHLEGERKAAQLQKQHEANLALMLKHLAQETNTSTSSLDSNIPPWSNRRDFNLDIYRPSAIHRQKDLNSQLNVCEIPEIISRYKLMDKTKEKDENKNKFIAKFQVLTKYHGINASNITEKQKHSQELTYSERAKESAETSTTKVTRQKNKIVMVRNAKTNV